MWPYMTGRLNIAAWWMLCLTFDFRKRYQLRYRTIDIAHYAIFRRYCQIYYLSNKESLLHLHRLTILHRQTWMRQKWQYACMRLSHPQLASQLNMTRKGNGIFSYLKAIGTTLSYLLCSPIMIRCTYGFARHGKWRITPSTCLWYATTDKCSPKASLWLSMFFFSKTLMSAQEFWTWRTERRTENFHLKHGHMTNRISR